MAIKSLDQRLDVLLPPAPEAAAPVQDAPLEPMPAEQVAPDEAEPVAEPGTPDMTDEPVLVAGPADAAIRRLITRRAAQTERKVMPETPPGELPDALKAGIYKVIPAADQQLTEAVERAVTRRKTFGITQGAPGGTPDEPFNLARYQTEDAAAIVGGVADALGIKTKAVTFDEIKAKASESGISEAFMSRLIGNDGRMMANAVETYKALEVLESSANELDKLFRMVADGTATDVDKLKLRQQVAFHSLLQKGVKGMQTETARALAVFRIPREGNATQIRQVLDEFGGDAALQDMANSYLTLETRAAKNQLVEKSMMSGVKDVWFTTYINGLLASPVTQAKNMIGNTLFGVFQIPERTIAALYGNVLPQGVRSWKSLVPGNTEEKIAFDEAITMALSLRNGITEGFSLASNAFRTGVPSDLRSKIEAQRGLATPSISSAAFDIAPDKWFGKAVDFYGTAVSLPGRVLMTQDEFFKGVLYRMEMNAQVARRAKTTYREGIESGLSEADAGARALLETEQLLTDPPRDLDDLAMEFARRGTFTADLPPALANLQKTFNHPALKVIVPFFRTPANIGLEVIERTPFAPLSSRFREDIAKGGIYRDLALSKVTLGSALLATFGSYATEGKITGSGPKRKSEREALERTGWRPYSIKVGDDYYSYAGMEPISALLAISADYAEYAQKEPDAGKIEEVALGGAFGLMEFLKEQPYLQGVADMSRFLQAAEGEKAKTFFNDLAKQYGGFAIGGSPIGAYNSLVASIERLYDPTAKDTRASPDMPMGLRGFAEAFNKYRNRLPSFNDDLPEQLNLWGEPIMQGQGKAYEMVLPTRVSPAQFSTVDDNLVRIGSPIGLPDRKLQGVELDASQYNRLITIYSRNLGAKQGIAEVFNAPGFSLLPLDEQQKAVQLVHSKYMDAAKKTLISEDPALQSKLSELETLRKANGIYYKP